ncbi:MAG: HAD-IA family hydrolase [Alphaproteobacteria bacterium]|nr:HAD-IA family hydrolase [Alphaproteobacteria bacterium]
MPKFAVFDVDGTLVDSRQSIARAMAQAFAALDLPPPGYDETRRIVGLSLAPAIKVLAPDLPEARYPALAEAYKNAFIANRAAGLVEPLYDGARETLLHLRDDGWTLGIATGKARRGVDVFLANHGLADLFECAFCADDGPGKPDPHMLRLNMDAVRRPPADTVMIGDTSFDMQMARAAGAYAQGVSWGFHTIEEVRAGGAHHVADTFATLRAELGAFARR